MKFGRGRELLERGGKEGMGGFMVINGNGLWLVMRRRLEQEEEGGFEEDLRRVNKAADRGLK